MNREGLKSKLWDRLSDRLSNQVTYQIRDHVGYRLVNYAWIRLRNRLVERIADHLRGDLK